LELVLQRGHAHASALGEPGADVAVRATAPAPVSATTPVTPPVGGPAARGLSFPKALLSLAARGEITSAAAASDEAAFVAAQASHKQLSGMRKSELGAVIKTLQTISRSGGLTPARLPELILTLNNNRQWWTTGPLLAADQRVGFPGSHLVWEFYPGQGLQIQWLGTFGAANGFWDQKERANLASLLNEALSLAVPRGNGIAWEYDFTFDGGSPPWVSAITEGTAIEALTHAATMLHDPVYLTDAHDGLGIFLSPAPVGIASPTPAGTFYLIYSFAPHEYVINAFIQSLVGLFTLGYQGDTLAQTLFQQGNAEARVAVPSYNTGSWSLYDQYSESDLSYHELLTGFLQDLCTEVKETTPQAYAVLGATPSGGATGASGTGGTPAVASTAPSGATGATAATGASGATSATGTSGASGGTGTTGTTGATGGTGTTGSSGGTGPTGTGPVNPNAIYCTTAKAFTADLKRAPAIQIKPPAARAHRVAHVQFTLSKISNVRFSASNGTKTVVQWSGLLGHGARTLNWRPPSVGAWTITLSAVDLAGNHGTQTATVMVAPKGSSG
jgi:hypothetical protein